MTHSKTSTHLVAEAVILGLKKEPKHLPSWLFYDERGDKIFQAIMNMPEYYLTACEYEALDTHKRELLKIFRQDGSPFKLVEFGAGDGLKTEIIVKHLLEHQVDFSYHPVDISNTVLNQLEQRLLSVLPNLQIKPVNTRYENAVSHFHDDEIRKVYLFLGANIGNFSIGDAQEFTKRISDRMNSGDQLLIGFDLKKDPRLIQAAYDDPHGITRDFNLNLLVRLNRELQANFELDEFHHYPIYNPETGTTKSYLISLKSQYVHFKFLDTVIHLDRWEPIHTETSQKYDIEMIRNLGLKGDLTLAATYYDCKHYFCDALFTKI